MQNLESLTFDINDIMRIFGLSRPSVYRRLRDAREGRGGFPLTIPARPKQKLLWCAEAVMIFLQSAGTPQPPLTPLIPSTKSIQDRHAKAMRELDELGRRQGYNDR